MVTYCQKKRKEQDNYDRAVLIMFWICTIIFIVMLFIPPDKEIVCWRQPNWTCFCECDNYLDIDEPQNMSWEYGLPDWEREKFYK